MKKIFDVETYYKGATHREAVHADTPEEALDIITKKYSKERVTRITERKTE